MPGKRANGEGSVYQRKDGRWAASLSAGRGKRKHFLGRTRLEVSRKLNAALKARDDGLPVVNERQTVGQFLKAWVTDKKTSARPGTVRGYESKIRVHILPALGTITLAKLTPQRLPSFLARNSLVVSRRKRSTTSGRSFAPLSPMP